MSTLSEQAAAFRKATDQQYRDLVNGRITLEDLIMANTRKVINMRTLVPGDIVTLRFEGGADSYTEPAVFVGNVEENGEIQKRFRSTREDGTTYEWEAYRWEGAWRYGSSAQLLFVAQED